MSLTLATGHDSERKPQELSQRIALLQQILPFALMGVVMFYEVTRHLVFADAGHPILFAFEMITFGLTAPAVLWFTFYWIRKEVRARELAEGEADTRTRMLLEMHHRIKNNLQTVADLLSLELTRGEGRNAQESLRDSISRIKSIAVAHELLSTDSIGLTDITELARRVTESARLSSVRPQQTIIFDVTGPAILLPSKPATAFALVINELVGNALEHGLAQCPTGEIHVSLERIEGGVLVQMHDNGTGVGEAFDLHRNAGLGLQIVRTLVEKDLRGSIRMLNDSGTKVEFTISLGLNRVTLDTVKVRQEPSYEYATNSYS
jgi:two-component sensor histidine kinase